MHTPIITASDAALVKCSGHHIAPGMEPKTHWQHQVHLSDFFGRSTNLTASGQLAGELVAM